MMLKFCFILLSGTNGFNCILLQLDTHVVYYLIIIKLKNNTTFKQLNKQLILDKDLDQVDLQQNKGVKLLLFPCQSILVKT